jgi:HK97 family phage major capsid protein
MSINTKDLNLVLQEGAALTSKANWNKQDEKRFAYLQTAAAAIRAGASLSEIEQEAHNERAVKAGLPTMEAVSFIKPQQELEIRGWKRLITGIEEKRDMTEGNPVNRLGTYTGLGYFVPTGFYPEIFAAMAQHDVLFNPEDCTVIKSTNGRPISVPTAGDIENVASLISEAGSQTSVDIDTTGGATLGANSYSTPRFVLSMESFQDLDASLTAVGMFKQFAADRLARGISKDLLQANIPGTIVGLIPSLENIGAPVVTASGSSSNDGGSNTGANSLGSIDFKNALDQLDDAYAQSSKCAWVMNRKTLNTLSNQSDKYGNIVRLVQWNDGVPSIFGIRVKVSPGMQSIGASQTPVVLGDFTYWATRLVCDDMCGIAVYTNAPGLAENGKVGLRTFARAHGALLYSDVGSPSPFVLLANHS